MSNIGIILIAVVVVVAIASYFLFANNNQHQPTITIPPHTSESITTSYNATTTINATTTYNQISYNPATTYSITTSIPSSSNSGGLSNTLISVALQEYKAPYCEGISQAPVGQSGLPCAEEVGSTYHTFNSTSGAFDCAGFVQYVYSQIGIRLPRTAQAQFGNFYSDQAQTVPVPGGQSNTLPGDLVYFSIPGDHDPEPAHVAICLIAGCNTIIQDGGPPPGWPGTIAPLNAVLCTNPNASTARCIMGFREVKGVDLGA